MENRKATQHGAILTRSKNNPVTKARETFLRQAPADQLTTKLSAIKKDCFKSKIYASRHVSKRETQFQATLQVKDGQLTIKPFQPEPETKLIYRDGKFIEKTETVEPLDGFSFPVYSDLETECLIDIWPLIKVLRTFKKTLVYIYVTDKQMVIKQDRDRVALNFLGVKNA